MKVCHLTTHVLDRGGGTEIAAKKISKSHDVRSIGAGGILLYIRSITLAVRLIFSNYDIIHIHDMSGYGYFLLPGFLRKKTIYSCHGLWATYFGEKRPLSAKMLIAAQGRIIKSADVVVATSRFRVDEIKRIYGVDAQYIHNGVETDKFVPSSGKKKFDFLWVGTNPQKGLDFAQKTAKKEKGNLLVVGLKGKDTDDVKYMGLVSHSSMPQVYAKCRTLINYSTISRYDFVVLEAMASGMNVIINKESAEELMPGRKFGQAVEIDGKFGRKIAQELSWDKALSKYNDLYRRLSR